MTRFSVRTRLAAWYAGILGASLLFLGSLAFVILRQGLHRDVDESLVAVARAVAESAARQQVSLSNPSVEELVNELFGAAPAERYVQLQDTGGQVLAMSPGLRGRPFALSEEALHNASLGLSTYETVDLGDRRYAVRLLTFPVMDRGRVAQYVRVAISLEGVNAALRRFLFAAAALLPAAMLLAGGGGYLLARRALRPVHLMTQAVRRIEAASLDERVADPGAADELGRLARTLNDMLDRLEGAFAEVRRFTADASHELRTPLTILKGELEVALRAARDPAEYRTVLASCLEEVNRLTRLVENLLTLTRADAGQLALERRAVELGQILARVVARGRALGERRGVTVNLVEGPATTLSADAERLEQAFFNLVENGLKFTPAGGRVTVRWRPARPAAGVPGPAAAPPADPDSPAPTVQVEVQDTGIGISAAERELIFRRFYRADKARARAEGGSGLGLAIAKSIVEAHGGTVGVDGALGHGTIFTVTLPLAA